MAGLVGTPSPRVRRHGARPGVQPGDGGEGTLLPQERPSDPHVHRVHGHHHHGESARTR